MDRRFRVMDEFQDVTQVLTLSLTGGLILEDPKLSVAFARLANDERAGLVSRHPDRFAAGVASLPMTDMDAAIEELDRAVHDLRLKGLQLFTPTRDKPLDSPEFLPLFEKMQAYDLPIWIHPKRPITYADYRSLNESKHYMYHVFGWPYETTAAMTHLVFGGVLERFPGLKIITHHCGAMVPFFDQRIVGAYSGSSTIHHETHGDSLSRPPVDYFRMFYGDTALSGSTPGLMCGYAFFGADHLLFGTDMPFDPEFGARIVRRTIQSVEQMVISPSEREMIYEGNAKRLMHL
jgi:predicted TIM-barrel fold metal-dependent hydrolase